jgi:hypothetical protein
MTKVEYELIAEEIRFSWARGELTQLGLNRLSEGLAEKFKQRNERFDVGRFLNSCGWYRKGD